MKCSLFAALLGLLCFSAVVSATAVTAAPSPSQTDLEALVNFLLDSLDGYLRVSEPLFAWIRHLLNWLEPLLLQLLNQARSGVEQQLPTILNLLDPIFDWFENWLPQVLPLVQPLIEKLGSELGSALPKLKALFGSVLEWLVCNVLVPVGEYFDALLADLDKKDRTTAAQLRATIAKGVQAYNAVAELAFGPNPPDVVCSAPAPETTTHQSTHRPPTTHKMSKAEKKAAAAAAKAAKQAAKQAAKAAKQAAKKAAKHH
eukprot:m.56628 g.56628  ORF g.56628 m.56628 type:complete len:258 (-) comp15729_c0_seq2:81-854(-)